MNIFGGINCHVGVLWVEEVSFRAQYICRTFPYVILRSIVPGDIAVDIHCDIQYHDQLHVTVCNCQDMY